MQQHRKGQVWRAITAALLIVLIFTVVFLRLSVFAPYVVLLNSMEPTLHPDDRVLVNRWAYRHHPPQSGEIILFQHPDEPFTLLFKRVIGAPGDRLAVARGYVMRNGEPLDEREYAVQDPLMVAPEWRWGIVPEGHVFVLGDNRNHSEDSRDYGPVPLENVIGRAGWIVWPWARRQRLEIPPPPPAVENRRRAVL